MTIDYSLGKIYKIEAKFEVNVPVDVGATTKPFLSQRFNAHKQLYIQSKNENIKTRYCSVFQLFDKYGVDNIKIVLLELVNANSKDELMAREAYYINLMNTVNTKQEQRCQLYNAKIQEDDEQYMKTLHPDQLEFYKQKKQEDGFLNNTQMYHIKYNKEYYEKNRAKALEKFVCECGSNYTHNGKKQHLNSKKHKKFVTENIII